MSSAAASCTPAALASAAPALKAAILGEALPYLRRYSGQTILVKYGGHAMGAPGRAPGEDAAGDPFARDIVLLKQVGINPIVVHGGGPQIGQMLQRLGIKSRFVDGLRVTDRETMEVVEMVLAGTINKQLVAAINAAGGCAVGLSGKDGGLIRASKLTRNGQDLGFVGEPERVDDRVLASFRQSDIIPVIAPIGVGAAGETYNINADTVAGAVAAAVKARRFLLLTDVPGVLDAENRLITELTAADARRLIADGTTMHGLMALHRVDPHEFMAFVHDVDLSVVPANPALIAALEGLGGRKLVYTNGSTPHAENLLQHLGISHCFDGIFDIVASEFAPKPAMAPFRSLVRRYGVEPRRALMIEDMARNLAPAAELGMTTAWVRTEIDWAAVASNADYIHYVVEDLAGF